MGPDEHAYLRQALIAAHAGKPSAQEAHLIGRDELRRAGVEQILGYVGSFVLAGVGLLALVRAFVAVPFEDMPTVVVSFAVGYNAALLAPILPRLGG